MNSDTIFPPKQSAWGAWAGKTTMLPLLSAASPTARAQRIEKSTLYMPFSIHLVTAATIYALACSSLPK